MQYFDSYRALQTGVRSWPTESAAAGVCPVSLRGRARGRGQVLDPGEAGGGDEAGGELPAEAAQGLPPAAGQPPHCGYIYIYLTMII